MKIIKWLLLAVLTGFTYGQGNLIYTQETWLNGAASDTIDIGLDTEKLLQDYSGGNEIRLIGLWFDGTFTNTNITVLACTSLTGTYDAVTNIDGTALTITMASNKWIYLDPTTFAGIRFIRLLGDANEAAERSYVLIKRRY